MSADISELLARVDAASGPDRSIDRALWAAIQGGDYPGKLRYTGFGIPPFTASIGDALALVERALPGWTWSVDGPDHCAAASILRPDGTLAGIAAHNTPPLAILATLLTALRHNAQHGATKQPAED